MSYCPFSSVFKLKCERSSGHFQPGEGHSMGLLRDCETSIFVKVRFQLYVTATTATSRNPVFDRTERSRLQMSPAFVLSGLNWLIWFLSIFVKSMNFLLPGTVWFYPGTGRGTSAPSPSDRRRTCEVGTQGHQRPDLPFVCQPEKKYIEEKNNLKQEKIFLTFLMTSLGSAMPVMEQTSFTVDP